MTDLPSLIERLKAAEGPSQGLDFDVASALGLCQTRNGVAYQWSEAGSTSYLYYPPAFTASLDATITLVERKLPGWKWVVDADNSAAVYYGKGNFEWGATPVLALLTALLTALQEQEGKS